MDQKKKTTTTKKKDIIHLERESVIPIPKHNLIAALKRRIPEKKCDRRNEFLKLCQRVEYTIRAWYHLQFEELMQLYAFFEPIHGAKKLAQRNLSSDEINVLEQKFLNYLFKVMDKSNFKITTNEEIEIALSAQYRLNLPIVIDESKIEKMLFARYFQKYPQDDLPCFADKFIIFRRGFGVDQMTGYFFKSKVDVIIARLWRFLLMITGLKRLLFGKLQKYNDYDHEKPVIVVEPVPEHGGLYVERIRIEKMKLSVMNFLREVTIQEPTFERIIVVYRRASSKKEMERNICVKHFKSIPMADMEIVLPEKKNPGLTPLDWAKFLVSAIVGLVTVSTSLSIPKADIWVVFAFLTAVAGYCTKTYFTFQKNLVAYQSLITQSLYEKQLDSGRGTLLHLCDEVIQQEVKEVILSFFMLMEQGKATIQELDERWEKLLEEEFGESCDFDVEDAVQKLDKLGIVHQDAIGNYVCVDVKHASDVIGTTAEELVLKAAPAAGEWWGCS